MEEGTRFYRLGVFVVASLVVLFAVVFVLGGRKLFQPTFTFETYFDESVAGLEIGAPLRYRGVPMGEVSEILTSSVAYEEGLPLAERRNYIVVRATVTVSAAQAQELRRDVAEMVRRGLRAQTQLAGITGQLFLSVDFVDGAKYPPVAFGWTPKYQYVPSAPSLSGEIIAHIQTFLANLNEADVKRLADNLNTLLLTLNDRVSQLPVGQLSENAQGLLKNLNVTITSLRNVLEAQGIKKSVDNIAAVTARLRKMADDGDLDGTIRRIDEAVDRLNGLLGDNQYDARMIVQDLRATAENLRSLSASVKRYPAGALIGGPPEKVELPRSAQ
jgi:phospholipid/cholesterol/gamma-HCH transport system substrate-binding protein/paraquat-inducible protein B